MLYRMARRRRSTRLFLAAGVLGAIAAVGVIEHSPGVGWALLVFATALAAHPSRG